MATTAVGRGDQGVWGCRLADPAAAQIEALSLGSGEIGVDRVIVSVELHHWPWLNDSFQTDVDYPGAQGKGSWIATFP